MNPNEPLDFDELAHQIGGLSNIEDICASYIFTLERTPYPQLHALVDDPAISPEARRKIETYLAAVEAVRKSLQPALEALFLPGLPPMVSPD